MFTEYSYCFNILHVSNDKQENNYYYKQNCINNNI